MSRNRMRDPSKKIKRLRERVHHSEEITEEDAQVLLEFSDQLRLLRSEYGDFRHEKLLRHCIRMAEKVGGLAASLDSREEAEEIVRWIHRTYDNEETNHDYRTALRVFGKRVTETEELPASLDWIPSGYRRNYDPQPDPGEMLRWHDDVEPMIEATMNNRDAALIAVAWDAGARSNELHSLSIGDISDNQYGLQITVDGKTGQRTVTLIPSVPYLQRWLTDHPAEDNVEAPLWSNLHKSEEISYQMFLRTFNAAAERAGIDKPVTPTNFRKSSASHLASKGMNQASIEDHHGWTRGSDVAARYVSVFARDSDRELAKIHGLDIEDDSPDPLTPLECTRCARKTPRDEDFCVWCGQALDRGAVEQVKQRERTVRETVLDLVKKDSQILAERDRIESLLTLIEEHPSLLEDAERFLEALEEPN